MCLGRIRKSSVSPGKIQKLFFSVKETLTFPKPGEKLTKLEKTQRRNVSKWLYLSIGAQ
jgi:hypothetical protein